MRLNVHRRVAVGEYKSRCKYNKLTSNSIKTERLWAANLIGTSWVKRESLITRMLLCCWALAEGHIFLHFCFFFSSKRWIISLVQAMFFLDKRRLIIRPLTDGSDSWALLRKCTMGKKKIKKNKIDGSSTYIKHKNGVSTMVCLLQPLRGIKKKKKKKQGGVGLKACEETHLSRE